MRVVRPATLERLFFPPCRGVGQSEEELFTSAFRRFIIIFVIISLIFLRLDSGLGLGKWKR